MSEFLFSVESEQAVLGSMLIEPGCIRAVSARLREDDFYLELNREIFRTLVQMDIDGKTIDGLTAFDALRVAGLRDVKQNRVYLAQLMEVTPTAANVMEYVDILLDRSKRRHLWTALQEGMKQLGEGASEEDVLPGLEQALTDGRERSAGDLLTPTQQVDRFYRRREIIDSGETPYVRTGFRQLDKQLGGGLQNAGLYFLAARPAVGKTTLALNIAEWAAKAVGPVLFVSLEMDDEQVTSKRVAALAKLNYEIVLSDTLTEGEYQKVATATAEIGKTPIIVNAGAAATVGKIASMARGRKDFRLVIVDHFSLIQVPGKQDRVKEYTAVSNQLKRLARSLKIPVLVLAQLNRANEQRSDKRPALSDLRETGAAEQDADGVITLHRADYYDKDARPEPGAPVLVDANVIKNRHGGTGHVQLSFFRQTGIFRESYVK